MKKKQLKAEKAKRQKGKKSIRIILSFEEWQEFRNLATIEGILESKLAKRIIAEYIKRQKAKK